MLLSLPAGTAGTLEGRQDLSDPCGRVPHMLKLSIIMSDKPRRPATYEGLEALPPFEALEFSLSMRWEV